MSKEQKNVNGKINMEDMLEKLAIRKQAPRNGYVLIILLYLVATLFLSKTARNEGLVMMLGKQIPISSFTGVLSAIGNICIIFLVVFYRKTGYFTAIALLLLQFPMLLINFFIRQNYTSIPGIFTNLFTMMAITILFINNSKVTRIQKRIQMQAVTDSLTGIPNRFACDELLDSLVERKIPFGLVSVDINNFKTVNDTMGHEVGNKMLIEIASRWKELADTWQSDTVDFVTRLGGDEYAIVIRGYNSDKEIIKAISKYKSELERAITIDDCDYFMTACFGYAEFPKDLEGAQQGSHMMSLADAAMHEAKRNGNTSGIIHFTPDLLSSDQVFEMERIVRTALEEDNVFCYLQPQFDLDHKLHGFEALARMKDSEGNFVSPGEFIPVAEKAGLIDRVDLSVFKKSAIFLSQVLQKTDSDIKVSFNISVRHLMKNNFVEEIRAIIDETGIPADHLEIEITESIMIDSAEKALERIEAIKDMGMSVAIDDFGTGYSSLSYLDRLPADMLKIDKSFIDAMNTRDSSLKYVESIISIGHVMGMEVISEGVETQDQLDTLKSIGCDFVQGFVWGRPLPPEEAMKVALEA